MVDLHAIPQDPSKEGKTLSEAIDSLRRSRLRLSQTMVSFQEAAFRYCGLTPPPFVETEGMSEAEKIDARRENNNKYFELLNQKSEESEIPPPTES